MWERELIRHKEMTARGYTATTLRKALATRRVRRLTRGVFVFADHPGLETPWGEYELRARAVGMTLRTGVVSHVSAAALHGLWHSGRGADPIHSTNPGASSYATRDRIHHVTRLDASDVTVVDGIPVTTPARTVVDTTRLDVSAGFITACAALHLELTTPEALADQVRKATGRTGAARARRAIGLADGRVESPLEAHSLLVFAEHGLPRPTLQPDIRVNGRVFRPDFLWKEEWVIGECDGAMKYADAEGRGALVAEKQREDQLRAAGYDVIRWGASELRDPDSLCARIHGHLRRARRRSTS